MPEMSRTGPKRESVQQVTVRKEKEKTYLRIQINQKKLLQTSKKKEEGPGRGKSGAKPEGKDKRNFPAKGKKKKQHKKKNGSLNANKKKAIMQGKRPQEKGALSLLVQGEISYSPKGEESGGHDETGWNARRGGMRGSAGGDRTRGGHQHQAITTAM